MSLPLLPKRGLTPREVTALLIMVASQLIIGVMMLRMMMANQGVASVGFTEVLPTIQPSFHGAQCEAQMNDGKNGMNFGGNIDCSNFNKDAKMKEFNVGQGIDASEYLLRTKIVIGNRISCHRTFVTEKKNSLVKGLWEVIEGIYELEEMAAGSRIDESFAQNSGAQRVLRKGDGATDGGVGEDWEVVKFAQNPAYPADEHDQFRAEISYMEDRVTGFRRAVEEIMEKNDVEGVLNMVRKSLKGFGPNAQFVRDEKNDGNSEEKMMLAQKSKEKVNRALSSLWEIFQDMDEEMKDTERWLRDTETALKSVVHEFKMEWTL
ncbi:uncharacterized protein EAE97_002404 [Botrytis byssoidea]|uniref:Uncharacterized protein n=1 Tax=Botrytis byssoidea TaxID=139641 RepID=A0A9P5LXN2_9HELO|nr:uncharacterized protein EAE97_002404 [Botrytis byssoidea]KAF7950852.1 hypothetical protein EAE97_002404 [Botrytis byssoidea]